ncbi:hypothetical protein M407DRAFT_4620 [Tulasnella calospora MUT 4182]|uniref:NADP-dependent oxidoreductase domain-containing protein n=1 Tax=Tulasnella calospora MUT 4182 TaxID=1051891 RepID=A0A0C3QT22_9AGAM|nr:hypothetical protein M407DRAFT_4620 [Tulasnella calospora MUT 4182]
MTVEFLTSSPLITLNNGYKMPAIGLGCWMGSYGEGERCEQMVRTALKVGYRHFDTAAGYQNEEHTGRALHSPLFTDETIVRIAEKYGVSTGQVLLSWGVQRGTSVVPKSEKEERQRSNLKLLKFDSEDLEAIDAIHRQPGKNKNVAFRLGYVDGKPGIFGWTYEQLGWEYAYE